MNNREKINNIFPGKIKQIHKAQLGSKDPYGDQSYSTQLHLDYFGKKIKNNNSLGKKKHQSVFSKKKKNTRKKSKKKSQKKIKE